MKGIYTTKINKKIYMDIYNDLQQIKLYVAGNLLTFSNKSWIYLELSDFNCSSYSAWMGDENIVKSKTVLKRINDYYKFNDNKKAKYIYVPKSTVYGLKNIKRSIQKSEYTLYKNKVKNGYFYIKKD